MASSSPSERKPEMEANAFHGIAPSPSSPPPVNDDPSFHCYDVFINHRGPDVKETLALALHEFLQYLGLKVFLDSPEFQMGETLSANIQHAICSSSVYIAIFSKHYAESPSCLAELQLMQNTGAKIVPLFYQVVPYDLRYIDTGAYAAAFATYREKKRYIDNLEQWKQALCKASFVNGIQFQSSDWDTENLLKIGDIVFNEMRDAKKKFQLDVPDHLVGLEEAIQKLEVIIDESNNGNGKIVGIVGRAGVGKTTLAKKFYNIKHPTFCRSSFLFNVGEMHRNKRMLNMRYKLMCDLRPLPLSSANFQLSGPKEGFGVEMIKSQLEDWYSKPLIILDGVDHTDQLEELALNELLHHGALILVTCRDANVLQSFQMVKIYEMRGLDAKYASQLFCWHAFRHSHPPKGREKLVEDNLKVSSGMPSNLKILGQHIYSIQNDIDVQENDIDTKN